MRHKNNIGKEMKIMKKYKLELEAYKGNKELEKIYMQLISKNQHNSVLRNELKRIRKSITLIDESLVKIPVKDRNFICDVYLENNLSMQQIMKKYNLNMNQYYRLIDKIIYENIEENESNSY